jgi:hypothetical protein
LGSDPNLELEIWFRMSGHIPLPLSNYTPYTPIYQQNFGDWSRLLIPFWSSCFWKSGARQ